MKPMMMFVALAVAVGAYAETEKVGFYTWTYRINDGTAEISGVSPAEDAVTIPSTLGGKPVTSIGEWAFSNCDDLTSVTIPNSVTSIGNDAFFGCAGLTSVTIGNGVTSIGACAFYRCGGLTSVMIGNGVTNIGAGAFNGCSSLTSVTIPSSVTSIGGSAFYDCRGLTSVKIPDGVMCIGDSVFHGCRGLTSVTIGNGVTSIGDSAFYGCSGLASVTIPNGVTSIGKGAFALCSGLVSVTIPNNVTSIGDSAFYYCTRLRSVSLPRRFEGVLDAWVFSGCYDLKKSYYDPIYALVFHRNDASDEKTADYDFEYGVGMRLPSLKSLGWARRGCDFLGWATSRANADTGKVWKKDWAVVSTAAEIGETRELYAVWALKPDSYAVKFIRNDGAGTWRTVGFTHGEKTRMPSLLNGLGWARRGYDFMGWELTTTAANDNTRAAAWKGDWAYVSTPVKPGETLTVYARWALKPGYYQIRFNKNDGSGKWRTLGFQRDMSTKLSSIAALGWERDGYTFVGWGSNAANAAAGKVWKADGAAVKNAADEGRTLSVYAIWESLKQ